MASQPAPTQRSPLTGKQKAGGAIALILAAVYAVEGGYTDHKSDPGGPTNFGVTQQVARQAGYTGDMRDFAKHCVKPGDVCADSIYTERYIRAPGYMPLVEIAPAVAQELVDTAVNMGPPRPNRWFQQSLNELSGLPPLAVDGKIGPATIARYQSLANAYGKAPTCRAVLARLDAKQAAEYARLVRVNPRLKVFYKGWTRHRIGNVDPTTC